MRRHNDISRKKKRNPRFVLRIFLILSVLCRFLFLPERNYLMPIVAFPELQDCQNVVDRQLLENWFPIRFRR